VDDFVILCPDHLVPNLKEDLQNLLNNLRIKFAKLQIGKRVTLLGLDWSFDARGMPLVEVSTKRKTLLRGIIAEMLKKDAKPDLQVIRNFVGKSQFVISATGGRQLQAILSPLYRMIENFTRGEYKKSPPDTFPADAVEALKALRPLFSRKRLTRVVMLANSPLNWKNVYTDASWNPREGKLTANGWLGVVVCHAGKRYCYRHHVVASNIREQCRNVQFLEAAAGCIGAHIARRITGSSHIQVFIDNDGAKFALLRNRSGNPFTGVISVRLRMDFSDPEDILWFSRVYTKHNVADAPTRLELLQFAQEMSPPFFDIVELIEDTEFAHLLDKYVYCKDIPFDAVFPTTPPDDIHNTKLFC
jgi:hypothetical protein